MTISQKIFQLFFSVNVYEAGRIQGMTPHRDTYSCFRTTVFEFVPNKHRLILGDAATYEQVTLNDIVPIDMNKNHGIPRVNGTEEPILMTASFRLSEQ